MPLGFKLDNVDDVGEDETAKLKFKNQLQSFKGKGSTQIPRLTQIDSLSKGGKGLIWVNQINYNTCQNSKS